MSQFRLLAVAVLVALPSVARSQDGTPPSPVDLARGLRENGMADLAVEYLNELKTPPADVAPVLPLEKAKCLLELANLETDESVRTRLVAEAKAGFDQFLAAAKGHPRTPEAAVALARLLTIEGKAKLQQAKKETDEEKRKAEAAKARPLFEDAARRYETAAGGLESFAKGDGLTAARKAEVLRDYYQAVLDRGINQYHLADTFLDTRGKDGEARLQTAAAAFKTFDDLWKKDQTHPVCWVARAWAAETWALRGEPTRFDNAVRELVADSRRNSVVQAASAAGVRMAQFFQLREQFVKLLNDPTGRGVVRDACRRWLREYPAARPTAETHAVSYYLGTVQLTEATRKENLIVERGKPAKPGDPPEEKVVGVRPEAVPALREADAEFRKIVQTDNEYTDRATRQRAKALRWLVGNVDRPAAQFATFDECYGAALVQMDRMRDGPSADRAELAGKVIDLLERATHLPAGRESAREATTARVSLAQSYNAANRPHQAAVLAESLARASRSPALVARTGLIALYGYQAAADSAPAGDDAARAADRDRMLALCRHVEMVASTDPAADDVRLQWGVLLSQAGRPVDMFDVLGRISARYPKLAQARLYQGIAAYELARPRGANEPPLKDAPPPDRRADITRRAIKGLADVPVPPKSAKPDESAMFVRSRLQLAQLHLTAGGPGYDAADKVARETAAVIAQFPDLPSEQKQAFALRCDLLRTKAAFGRTWPLYQDGKFKEAADQFSTLLAEVVKAGPAVKPNQEGEVAEVAKQLDAERIRLILVPTLNARIREGAVEKTGELLDQLKTFGGDLNTTARVVQQGIVTIRPTIDALRKEGKTDEADKLVAAVTGMVAKLTTEKNLPPEVRVSLGRAYKELGLFANAVELFAQVPAPDDPAFLPGDPKAAPPDGESADDKKKREAAYEANKTAAALYRLARLETLRCQRLDRKFEACDALLDDILGKDRKSGWGQKFTDFRREALYLSEAKGAAATAAKDAAPHWNAAIQGWRGWAGEYKAAIDNLKAKADATDDQVNEIRRKKDALKPTWLDLTADVFRCTVEAQAAFHKDNPAKRTEGFARQAAAVVDFEKNNSPLPNPVRLKLYALLESHPELKEAYTKAGGKGLLTPPGS